MRHSLSRFLANDEGATTVDWVVLAASIIALNIGLMMNMIEEGMFIAAKDVFDKIIDATQQGEAGSPSVTPDSDPSTLPPPET